MRLCERNKRDVWIYPWTGMDDDRYTWGEPAAIRAAVYPAESRITSSVYGESKQEQRLLLYDGGVKLSVGMGVSLDGGTPVWRIVSMEAWAHTRAVLERIGEESAV